MMLLEKGMSEEVRVEELNKALYKSKYALTNQQYILTIREKIRLFYYGKFHKIMEKLLVRECKKMGLLSFI